MCIFLVSILQLVSPLPHPSTYETQYCCKNNITKLRGFGPRANYTDRATAAYWRISANFCG
jgi:hypothetical protein